MIDFLYKSFFIFLGNQIWVFFFFRIIYGYPRFSSLGSGVLDSWVYNAFKKENSWVYNTCLLFKPCVKMNICHNFDWSEPSFLWHS